MKTRKIASQTLDTSITDQTLAMECSGCDIAAVQVVTDFTVGSITVNVECSVDKQTWVEPRNSYNGNAGWFSSLVYGAGAVTIYNRIDVNGFNYMRIRVTGTNTGRATFTMVAEAKSKYGGTVRVQSLDQYKIVGQPSGAIVGDGAKWFVGNWDRMILTATPYDYTSGTLDVQILASLDGVNYDTAWSIYDLYPATVPLLSVSTVGTVYPLIDCTCMQYVSARVYTSATLDCLLTPILTSKDS